MSGCLFILSDVRSEGDDVKGDGVKGEGDVGTSVAVGSPPPKRRKNDKETSEPVEGDCVCIVLYCTLYMHIVYLYVRVNEG